MKKVVVKTAFLTFAIVFAAAAIALVILFFGFPQTAADMFEKTGDYKSAARFAVIRYSRTGDVDDLGRVVMDSILADDDPYVEKYGQELIKKDGFSEYCAREDEYYASRGEAKYTSSIKQFICGEVSCSVYRLGDFDKGFQIAKEAFGKTDEFPRGNAIAALSVEVCVRGDGQSAEIIYEFLQSGYNLPQGQNEYLNSIKTQLQQTYQNAVTANE